MNVPPPIGHRFPPLTLIQCALQVRLRLTLAFVKNDEAFRICPIDFAAVPGHSQPEGSRGTVAGKIERTRQKALRRLPRS